VDVEDSIEVEVKVYLVEEAEDRSLVIIAIK
jgi:hypothetical protein